MSEQRTLEFTITYPPLDEAAADKQRDIDRESAIRDEQARMAPEIPGRTGEQTQPNPLVEGVTAAFKAVGTGAQNTMQGLTELLLPQATEAVAAQTPGQFLDSKMQALRKTIVDGLVQVGAAPFVGMGAAAAQELENNWPEMAQTQALDAGAGFTLRHIMAGAPALNAMTAEDVQAMRQPMTVKELLDLAVQSAPLAIGGVKKVTQAAKIQAPVITGQRGAVGDLNTARINAAARVKQVMKDLNTVVGESVLREHREVVSHGETIRAGQGWTLDQILRLDPSTLTLEQGRAAQQATRDAFNKSAVQLNETMQNALRAPDEASHTAFLDQFATATVLAGLDEWLGREFARGVEARKIVSEAERAPSGEPFARPRKRATPGEGITTAAVLDVAEHLLRDPTVTPETLAAALNALTQPQRRHWLSQLWNGFSASRDITFSAWIHSLLSGPITHATNILGSAVGIVADIPESFATEWLNAILKNAPDGAQLGQTARSVWTLGQAYEDMIRLVGQAWRENKAPFEEASRERTGGTKVMFASSQGKTEGPRISAANYGFDPNTGVGKFIEALGAALNSRYTPGAALMFEDAAMKGIPYRMELNAQAHRIATLEGLEGAAFEARRAFLERNPRADMIAAAEDKAVLLTLNKELGEFGQWFTGGANRFPLARVMFPFIRWSGNAIKWVNQRTPVLNTISISNWQDYMAGGELRNRAVARWAIGNGVGAVIAYNVWQGNITGGANTKQQRGLKPYQECGPYSIRSGGVCIENYIRTLGQVGQMIGAIADYVAVVNEIPDDQQTFDLWVAHGEGVAIAVGQMFTNQTAMQQLANVLETIKDPTSGRLQRGLARSLDPSLVRQVTRVMDDNLVREVRTIGDAIRSGLPLYVNDVEILRNPVTGEAIRYPEGVGPDLISPIFFSAKKDDPVFKEIVANKVNMPPLPWYVYGTNPVEGARVTEPTGAEGVRLRPDERDVWITEMTEKPRNGATLHEFLTEMVASDRYQRQSPGQGGGRALMLRKAYDAYKGAAFAELLKKSPTLEDRIREALTKKQLRLAPTP
jgi:hypothetical protein